MSDLISREAAEVYQREALSRTSRITIAGLVWLLCIGCFVSGAVTASIIWWAFK